MGFGPARMERGKRERPWKIHPVWRGIGCFMIILVPIMAWVGADVFMKTNRIIPFPADMYKPIVLSYSEDMTFMNNAIRSLNGFLAQFTVGQLLLTFMFLFIGFGIIAIIYAMMYRVVGPPRYGRFDSPPIKGKPRRR